MTAVAHGPVTTDEHEFLLVRGAIDLVARGGARRVTLVAVRFAEAILPDAQALAREHGVIVRAMWRGDGTGSDIAVEPIG